MPEGDPWRNELKGQIMRETKWPIDPKEMVAAFVVLVTDFRQAVIAKLGLEAKPEEIQLLDNK